VDLRQFVLIVALLLQVVLGSWWLDVRQRRRDTNGES
jgi:hypothetical protein